MKNRFTARRLAIDGVLIALYFALSFAALEIGGVKITFACLPVLLCAALFGPVDGLLVGLLGGLAEQLLKYGLTPTTLLWILPDGLRGLAVGLGMLGLCKMPLQGRALRRYILLCLLSGILVSLGNTFAFYIDSKMFGYYEYHMVFGILWLRLLLGPAASGISAAVTVPVIRALKRGL